MGFWCSPWKCLLTLALIPLRSEKPLTFVTGVFLMLPLVMETPILQGTSHRRRTHRSMFAKVWHLHFKKVAINFRQTGTFLSKFCVNIGSAWFFCTLDQHGLTFWTPHASRAHEQQLSALLHGVSGTIWYMFLNMVVHLWEPARIIPWTVAVWIKLWCGPFSSEFPTTFP